MQNKIHKVSDYMYTYLVKLTKAKTYQFSYFISMSSFVLTMFALLNISATSRIMSFYLAASAGLLPPEALSFNSSSQLGSCDLSNCMSTKCFHYDY